MPGTLAGTSSAATSSQRQNGPKLEHASSAPAPNHDDGRILLLDDPLARWIAFVAAGVLLLTGALLGAGIWAKRRVLKL